VSIQLTSKIEGTIVETLTGPMVDPNNATVSFNQLNTDRTLDANSTPPVSKHSEGQKALSSGAGTLDLTALPGKTADETVVGTGLKVQFAMFRNPITNANPITVTFGASSPYLLGGSGFKVILQPGEKWAYEGTSTSPAVASGAKNIDLAGTGSQALDYEIVLG
jgi:hypothetical protein